MIVDKFMGYPCCRSSCIYISSYVFFTSVNILWFYLIFNSHGIYIHFTNNDSTIKFILTFPIFFISAVITRCCCMRDTLDISEDENLLTYKPAYNAGGYV